MPERGLKVDPAALWIASEPQIVSSVERVHNECDDGGRVVKVTTTTEVEYRHG